MATDAHLLVLRHGQSEWNAAHRWQGTADSPLTALGRRQAAETAAQLAAIDGFHAVWTSHLSRASETAAIIAATLAIGEPRPDQRLREAYAGSWEGLTPDLIEKGWPGWLDQHRRPADFESFETVTGRVSAALTAIVEAARAEVTEVPARVLVVSHSGVIRSLIRMLGGIDDRIPNLGGIWIDAALDGTALTLTLGSLFDPGGIVVSGVDSPGEEPGV